MAAAEELDLSFAIIHDNTLKKEDKPKEKAAPPADDELDLSFATILSEPPKSYGDPQQPEPEPTPEPDRPPGYHRRQQRRAQPEKMGEFDMPFEFKGRQFKTALGLLVSYDPGSQLAVVKNNYPDLEFSQDEDGEIIVDGKNYGWGKGYLNAPGVSPRDIMQAGFNIAAFIPAGASGAGATTAMQAATRVGLASAGTQAGLSGAGMATGNERNLVDVGKDATIAGLTGFAFEGLAQKLVPAVKNMVARWRGNNGRVTTEIRNEFRRIALENGRNIDDISDEVIEQHLRQAEDGLPPLEREFGEGRPVWTRGERGHHLAETPREQSRALNELSLEDDMRSGQPSVGGNATREEFLTQEAARRERMAGAAQNFQREIGGGSGVALVDDIDEAGGAIRSSIQRESDEALDAVQAAYGEIAENAELSRQGAVDLFQTTRQQLTRNIETIVDETLTPGTRVAVAKLQEFENLVQSGARDIPIQRIEQARRILNNLAKDASNPTDKRQIIQLINNYDNYLDQAVIRGLFRGDEEALAQLRHARGLARDYFRRFSANEFNVTRSGRRISDKAGRFIERIVADDPSDKEIINSLFTASSFNNKSAANMARRFRDIMGEGSDEWNIVRQAAIRSMLKIGEEAGGRATLSPQATASAVRKALGNMELMQVLFRPQEIEKIRRFGRFLNAIDPSLQLMKSRETPSGKAAMKGMMDVVQRFFGMSGEPISMTMSGISVAHGLTNKSAARSVFTAEQVRRAAGGLSGNLPGIGGVSATTLPTAGAVSAVNHQRDQKKRREQNSRYR